MTRRHRTTASTAGAWRLFLFGMLLLGMLTAAKAHQSSSTTKDGQPQGLEIAAMTHSDMAFVSPYYGSIIALAERQTRPDERLRRLLNYTKIQKTYCLWGLVPGAIRNEDSAFNPCSHAYLAGAWALLQELATQSKTEASASEIVAAIDRDRAAFPTLSLCQSSAETFHTGEFIVPLQPGAAAGWLLSLGLAGGLTVAFGRSTLARTRGRMKC